MSTYCIDLTAYNTLARHRGIGRYVAYLGRALDDLKGELERDERMVALVNVRGDFAFSEDLDPEQHAQSLPPPMKQPKHYARYHQKRRWWLKRTLARLEPDVVHFVEGPAAMHHASYRSVVTCHDLIPLLMPQWYLRRRPGAETLQRARDCWRYRRADRVIAISRATREALVKELGMDEGRMTVIHQGIDVEAFATYQATQPTAHQATQPTRARIGGVQLPERYMLYVGASDPRKRVALLVRSCATVFRKTGVPLVLVGSWFGDLSDELRQALKQSPPGAVHRLGNVADGDLPALYSGADVFALPSVYEGFGLPVLEAMAAGCPVVTTRGGALSEVGGDAARYVAMDDEADLAAVLTELLKDEKLRQSLQKKGYERVRAFSWTRCARATLETYRWAAGRSAGPGGLGVSE